MRSFGRRPPASTLRASRRRVGRAARRRSAVGVATASASRRGRRTSAVDVGGARAAARRDAAGRASVGLASREALRTATGISTSLGSGRVPGRGRRTAAQRGEVGLERAHHAVAVVGLEARQRLDVGEQRVAAAGEVERSPPRAGGARSRPGGARRPRRRRRARRDWISASSSIWRDFAVASATASSAARCASSNVRWRMSSVSRVRPVSRLRGAEPLAQLLHALVGGVDRRGGALEQLVHLVAAVAAEALSESRRRGARVV